MGAKKREQDRVHGSNYEDLTIVFYKITTHLGARGKEVWCEGSRVKRTTTTARNSVEV